jgi:hypothetical protein
MRLKVGLGRDRALVFKSLALVPPYALGWTHDLQVVGGWGGFR